MATKKDKKRAESKGKLAAKKATPVARRLEPIVRKPELVPATSLRIMPAKPAAVVPVVEALPVPSAEPVMTGAATIPVAGIPAGIGPVEVYKTGEPEIIHVQQLGGPVNPFYGPFSHQTVTGLIKCYVNLQEMKDVNGIKLVQVYDETKTKKLGWGRVMGALVHIYEKIEE